MIDKEKTLEKFGYTLESLSIGSHKLVVAICDYCNQEYYPVYKNYLISVSKNKIANFDKLSCQKCRQIKKIEMKRRAGTWEAHVKQSHAKRVQTLKENGTFEKMKIKCQQTWANKSKEEIKEEGDKRKATNLKKYGVEHTSQLKETQEKAKKTWIEKYGNDNPSRIEAFKTKRRSTMQKRYGVDNAGQNETIKEKIKKTHQKKYGGWYQAQPEVIKNNKEKFNKTFSEHKETINAHRQATCLEKYGVNSPLQHPDIIKKSIETRKKNGTIKLINGKTVKEFCKENDISISYTNQLLQQNINPAIFDKSSTQIEQIIKDILIRNQINFNQNGNIGKRKYDFLIDNLIIECDSFYWHSDFNKKDPRYHQIKRDFYIESGFQPLFFRQHEIIYKSKIVESIILNKLNKSKKIFARNCLVIRGSIKEGQIWFEQNHLMGKGKGKIFFLIDKTNKEKVCAIQIVKKNNHTYAISRFASKLGMLVVGGFSKLIKMAHSILSFKILETFIDLRYGSGEYLYKLGFEKVTENLSFGWTNGKEIFHRMRFQKDSGYKHGLAKIWDCGQAKYIKSYK